MTPSSREARRLRASFLLRNASVQPLLGASCTFPPLRPNGQDRGRGTSLAAFKGCRTLHWQSQQRTRTAQNGMSELHGQRAKGESGVRATSTPSARRDIQEGPVFEQGPSGISSDHWKEGKVLCLRFKKKKYNSAATDVCAKGLPLLIYIYMVFMRDQHLLLWLS